MCAWSLFLKTWFYGVGEVEDHQGPPCKHSSSTCERIIGNNLKTSKKWNTQGSWNGTIVLTNKKITKVVCLKCYNHKTMACNN
jgi:hypothetical protein